MSGMGQTKKYITLRRASGAAVRTFAWLLGIFVSAVALGPISFAQAAATATTFTVSSTSITNPANGLGTPETFTAQVRSSGKVVTAGLVEFCDATAKYCEGPSVLGTAQLSASGTASLKRYLSPGSHSVKAVFAGTNSYATSASVAQNITVKGVLTVDTIAASGIPGKYTLTATVQGSGTLPLTGNVSFFDASNAKLPLGTVTLGKNIATSGLSALAFSSNGSEPIALAAGDFNNDGTPDLAIANLNSSAVEIFSVRGGVSNSVTVNGQNPIALAVGDFNNDGKLDVVIADFNSSQVEVHFGNGDFTFTGSVVLPTGIGPNSIAVGDFNRDGNADLAITNQFDSTVSIFLGDGKGNFAAPNVAGYTLPPTGSFPYCVVIGDFNNDGKQDLAIANYYDNNLTILLGNGDGTFTAAASPDTGIYPDWVTVGDFNGDGKADLAVTNSYSQTVSILLGTGNGTFTPAPTLTAGSNPDSVAVADFNLDGIEDLAVSSSNSDAVTLYLGKGDGTFTKASTAYGNAPYSVVVGDFGSTGIPDLAAAESGNDEVLVLLNQAGTSASALLTGIAVPGGGMHGITFSYPGNGEYYSSSANPVLLTGTPIATKTALTITPVTATVAQTVQLCATVTPASVGGLKPTGTVSYYAGTVALGSATPGAVFSTTFSTAGVRTITAKYSGDPNFVTSTSIPGTLTVK